MGNHLHQVFTFLLVTGRSLGVETIRREVLDYILKREPHLWPNIVFSLGKYLVTYCCDGGICPNPMHARGIAAQRTGRGYDLVLRFYKLLAQAIEVTRVSPIP